MKKFQKSLNELVEFFKNAKCEKCGKPAVHIMPFTNPPHFFCDECVPFKAEKKTNGIESKNRFLKISLDLHTLYVYVCMSEKGAMYVN